jgi:hypothetical protein
VIPVAEMLGHFLVQRCFQHVLGEQLQQPVRAGQRQPALLRLGHHRRRGELRYRSPRLVLRALLLDADDASLNGQLVTRSVTTHRPPSSARRMPR